MQNSKLFKISHLWLLLLYITIINCYVIWAHSLGSSSSNNKNSASSDSGDFTLQSQSLQKVESPPDFSEPATQLPSNLTISKGSTVKINCTATATVQPPPNITWTFNDEPIKRAVSYEKWSLIMWDVQPMDAGNYVCQLCNRFGCIEHTTKLIVPQLEAVMVAKEEDEIEDYEDETTIAALITTTTAAKTVEIETTESKHNEPNDGGNVETAALANQTVGGVHDSAPTFKKTDKFQPSIRKPAGVSIMLSCPANGVPMPTIKWKMNDTDVSSILRQFGSVTIKKWSMQMDETIAEDSGLYKCIVCNRLGCIEHTTNVIIVDRLRARPIMSDKYPQNRTVLLNRTAEMECRFTSELEPYIIWIKFHNRNISADDTEKYVPILQNGAHVNVENTKHFVILSQFNNLAHINVTNVTHADEGWYTCIAATTLGQAWARAYLQVVDKMPAPKFHTVVRSHPIWKTLVPIVVIVFVLGTVFIVYVLRRLKQERLLKHRIEMVHQWTKKVIIYRPGGSEGSVCELQMPVIKIEKQRTTFQTSGNLMDPTQPFNEYEFPLDANWEIPRIQLTLGSTLGEGAFGRVVRAEACGLQTSGQTAIAAATSLASNTIVAVKMVKEEHTDADMASLVREMEVMKMIGKHINIINLLGCCSQNGPLWVIVEFAPHGNLKDFLKRNRPMCAGGPRLLSDNSYLGEERSCSGGNSGGGEKPAPLVELTEKKLISFAFQIARGMEYLASRRCIHRDLAARNVLVSDDYVLKIADFGLARDIQDTDYYRKNTNGRLPIKWMAPESLQEKFYDSQSDVWSYGVLLWEIMTFGEQPYPNVISAEELYSYLITGQRMEKPPRCSLNIYMLMRQCWHFDGSARPTFTELVENLEKILQLANSMANEDYLDLSMPMLETPPSSSDEDDGEEEDDSGELEVDGDDERTSADYDADIDVIDGRRGGKGGSTGRRHHRAATAAYGDAERLLAPQRYQYTYKFN